jgi:hypothetical protein
MNGYDFINGICPYCISKINIHSKYNNLQTKICSYNDKYIRIFKSGDTLPLLPYSNYYGDIVPPTFLWIIKDKTTCCNKQIAINIHNKIIGYFLRIEDIEDIPITIPIYNENNKCIYGNPVLQYQMCMDKICENGLINDFNML